MKRILPLFALLLVAITATAAERSLDEARAAARSLWQRTAARHAPGHAVAEPRLVYTAESEQQACYYVFSPGEAGGYTVISGDDRLPAVVGYSGHGDWDETTLPPALKGFLAQYRAFLAEGTDEQIAEAAAFRAQQKHAAIEPLIKTQWDQTEPYNNMCPLVGTDRCLTGCTATSMAQILFYHKCPDRLLAEIPAYTSKTKSLSLPAIPAGEQYDWANMLNRYGWQGTESDAEKNAVAKLMYHIGCAVGMDYTPDWSSGAFSTKALIRFFGMDPETTRMVSRKSYSLAEWEAAIYAELAAQRPVLYSGDTSTSGHAFIVDGYEGDTGLYHVNWGWGGSSDDVYYDITILNPYNTSGAGASSSRDGYSLNNNMIIGLQPDNGKVDEVQSAMLTCKEFGNSYITGLSLNAGTLTATCSNVVLFSFNTRSLTRYVCVGYKTASGDVVTVSTPQQIEFPESNPDGSASGRYYRPDISFAVQEGGSYVLQVMESADGNHWTPCQLYRTNANSALITVSGGQAQMSTLSSQMSAAVALSSASSGYAGMTNTIDIALTNSGNQEYYDRIYVMSSTSSTMPSGYTYCQGVSVEGGQQHTMSFAYTPSAAGDVNFWVLDAKQTVIGTATLTFAENTPPQLSFVSITVGNASGKKGYHSYSNYSVEMDEVSDTKADFVFEIRNDGGYYEADFPIGFLNKAATGWTIPTRHLVFPAHATTPITISAEGEKGDVVGVQFYSYQGKPAVAALTSPITHWIEGGSRYYTFTASEIAYLAGSTPTAIAAPTATATIDAPCYNLNGQRVSATARGIIIQNGRKIVRR